ncbi:hypothetical protein SO802_000079 [Lithocarpus litseifolius]|uniref:Uncharacterized protein n=1 Tax=Lithocarpus litseifolius TaxID=425828 RepID=A0AAW2DUM1_9ROSI
MRQPIGLVVCRPMKHENLVLIRACTRSHAPPGFSPSAPRACNRDTRHPRAEEPLPTSSDDIIIPYLAELRTFYLMLALHSSVLDSLVDPLPKTINFKPKQDAVKQEVDHNEDMVRSALRAIASLNRISYCGKILPHYTDGTLCYAGSLTHVLAIDHSISFTELIVKLEEFCGSSVNLQCQLPTNDLGL